MDNSISNPAISHQHPQNNARIIVTLDPSQYAFYRKTYIELQAPDGQHLEYVGKTIQREAAESTTFRLREQVALVSSLLGSIDDTVVLPVPAVMGLADLFCRIQEVWRAEG